MKISKLILLLVAVLTTSNCLTMHALKRYILSKPFLTPYAKVLVYVEDDRIMFKGCNYNSANVTKDSEGTYTFSDWSRNFGSCDPNNDPTIRSLFNSAKTSK